MTERERQRRARQSAADINRIQQERQEGGSRTIDAWCKHRGLSRSMFYILDEQNKAPKTYRVGSRRYISAEADAAWLRDREAEVAA